MGRYLTSDDVHERFAVPLANLAAEFDALCKKWEEMQRSGAISRPDLLLNHVTPEAAIGTLRKFLREASGKLEDAVAGVYRYRKTQVRPKPRRPARKSG